MATATFQVHGGAASPQWSSGLCDCSSDGALCCITCWCPCITFGQIAEIVDRGTSSCGQSGAVYGLLCALTGCQWIYSCVYRSKMRAQYGLPDEPCNDCCVHFCCEPCSLCQMHKELQSRGFNMSIGWHANMEKPIGVPQGVPVPPAPIHGMQR